MSQRKKNTRAHLIEHHVPVDLKHEWGILDVVTDYQGSFICGGNWLQIQHFSAGRFFVVCIVTLVRFVCYYTVTNARHSGFYYL